MRVRNRSAEGGGRRAEARLTSIGEQRAERRGQKLGGRFSALRAPRSALCSRALRAPRSALCALLPRAPRSALCALLPRRALRSALRALLPRRALRSALCALILVACRQQSDLPKLFPVPDAHLVNESGAPVTLAWMKGSVTVYDFIYTTCSGTCPIMTNNMRALTKQID